MVRTQIYLTEAEQHGLQSLALSTGRSQSDLIRQAVDTLLAQAEKPDRGAALRHARGIWQHRTDLPDFVAIRSELDRTSPDIG